MNRYFQEVIDAHHLISDVLGKQDTSGDICTKHSCLYKVRV